MPHNPRDTPLPRLYRPEEIAEALGCSAWWVKDRARRSLIPHTRVGRAYRFTAGHLAEIVRLHEETPARPAPSAESAAVPSSTAASRDDFAQPPRPLTTPANRLRARPPRRAQYDATA
ncbi:helix-turn-helix domain-containing protein [Streptomyces sp. TRM 70361]|uniref:helix-turn-helix domain-containing protein n=1 Tax=Streptomyces sp. TRM 70361 TaxID=3116553 RepID=UPI002E7BDEDB|nr:helix-turn-helix domain-containing protein [Streptomyces sp. TRM 70361]MEE1941443.1 helix-turn-helix domain-containing protein [Streptomyces sp. TRM 70361]